MSEQGLLGLQVPEWEQVLSEQGNVAAATVLEIQAGKGLLVLRETQAPIADL